MEQPVDNGLFDVLCGMIKSTIRVRMEEPDQRSAIVGRQFLTADQGFKGLVQVSDLNHLLSLPVRG